MKQLKVREEQQTQIYVPQEVVHIHPSPRVVLNISYAVLILILAAFGLVGQDLGILTAYTIIVLAGAIPGWLLYKSTGKFWVGVLLGMFIVSVIGGSDMDEKAFSNAYVIASALQHISWVGIGVVVAMFLITRKKD